MRVMKKLITLTSSILISLSLSSAAFAEQVSLQTNKGEIVIELNEDKAPLSVENFLTYVNAGFYDGTIFHRVIPGFMVQGGGFDKDYAQKTTRDPIQNEAQNGLQNSRGTVAMARTSAPHSGTAQFFINTVDNGFLNHSSPTPRGWGYAVFGTVIKGMDVVDAITAIPTGAGGPFPGDVPQTPVIIEKASVITE